MNINSGIKQAVILTIGIMAVVLFLPFLVSCSQNRKAPAVSPQTAVGKTEKNETAKVQYLTTSDFRKKIMDYEAHPDEWVFAGSRPAVIDFYTTWCGPCKMMAPVVESLAGKYAGKIDFYKVDIDQESELASVFGISRIPTFLPLHPRERQTICADGCYAKGGFRRTD